MKKLIKSFLPIFILILNVTYGLCAVNLDSLTQILNTSKHAEERIDAYNKLGWELQFSDNAKSREYLNESFKLLSETKRIIKDNYIRIKL